jgi:hypothetical protein
MKIASLARNRRRRRPSPARRSPGPARGWLKGGELFQVRDEAGHPLGRRPLDEVGGGVDRA